MPSFFMTKSCDVASFSISDDSKVQIVKTTSNFLFFYYSLLRHAFFSSDKIISNKKGEKCAC